MKREYNDYPKYDDQRAYAHSRSKVPKPASLMANNNFRSLSIRRITMKIDDITLQNVITSELHQFGDFTVKVYKLDDEKIALINFKYPNDASCAYSSKSKISIGNKVFDLEPFDSLSSMNPSKRSNRMQNMSLVSMSRNLTSENYNPAPVMKYPQNRSSDLDGTPTRTLFLGNLENDIEDHDVLSVFGMFGHIEQIDIKRSAGQYPYAFIKFENVDMAITAKARMRNKNVKNNPCKIGFGKMTPSRSIYIGGLGKWSTKEVILNEFTKYGFVSSVFYEANQNFAIVIYDSQNHANEAIQNVKELPFGRGVGSKKVYLDYISDDIAMILKTNLDQISQIMNSNSDASDMIFSIKELTFFKGLDNFPGFDSRRGDPNERYEDQGLSSGPVSLQEIIKTSELLGESRFVMKKSIYPTRVYHISGSKELSNSLFEPEPKMHLVKRRISLSQEWLSDASTLIKRVINDKHRNLSVMIGCTGEEKESLEKYNDKYPNLPVKLEHLRTTPCLIAYLRQKQACLLVNVDLTETKSQKTEPVNFYIFPPSGFSLSLLKLSAPRLACQVASQNNHVVILACKV